MEADCLWSETRAGRYSAAGCKASRSRTQRSDGGGQLARHTFEQVSKTAVVIWARLTRASHTISRHPRDEDRAKESQRVHERAIAIDSFTRGDAQLAKAESAVWVYRCQIIDHLRAHTTHSMPIVLHAAEVCLALPLQQLRGSIPAMPRCESLLGCEESVGVCLEYVWSM